MSATAIKLSGSDQRSKDENVIQQDIAKLAYALWQQRGAPIDGTPELDWTEAEKQLRGEQASIGNRTR